jgi:hypothetical protein
MMPRKPNKKVVVLLPFQWLTAVVQDNIRIR